MPKINAVPVVQEQEENRQVRRDLIKVVILNAIFFAILIGLYFYNHSTGAVTSFFEKILKF
jgi:hypothetical protein